MKKFTRTINGIKYKGKSFEREDALEKLGITKENFELIEKVDDRKKIFSCPHCNKSGMNYGNMHRWHFDNCKTRPK